MVWLAIRMARRQRKGRRPLMRPPTSSSQCPHCLERLPPSCMGTLLPVIQTQHWGQLIGSLDCWGGLPRAIHPPWGLCSPPMDTCAIFVCIFFSCIYSVYVATSPEAISTETLPFFPWHIFALRRVSLPPCVCVCVCVCVLFKTVSICSVYFNFEIPRVTQTVWVCVHVYTHVCAHARWK